jgi:hypothetical protein
MIFITSFFFFSFFFNHIMLIIDEIYGSSFPVMCSFFFSYKIKLKIGYLIIKLFVKENNSHI